MAKYQISAETATSFPTLVLPTADSENWDALQSVTEIDLNGCSVTFQGMFISSEPNTSLTSVNGGKILNTYSLNQQDGTFGVVFAGCISLTDFTSDLSNLVSGYAMFDGCFSLSSFSSNLSNVVDGEGMFNGCFSLSSFTSDLSSLENGYRMFSGCTALQSVKIKCSNSNEDVITKANLSIRQEATLEVSTDGGATWHTVEE